MSSPPAPSPWSAIGTAFASLVQPPFRALVAISLLIALTSTSFGDQPDETQTALWFVLLVASIYLQIAIILAAGRQEPEPSADAWLRGAFRRRVFWRLVGTSLVVVLGLMAGALILVVGIFVVGALLGLAQSASVLERKMPMDAITRSAKIASTGRLAVGVVFGILILVPTAATETADLMGWTDRLGPVWPALLVVAELATIAGSIALTKMYVAMGGEPTPSMDQLAPTKPQPGPRP